MKTLKNHTIYYDEVCPMCQAYTGAFVRSGMLDKNGRAPYQQIDAATASRLDMNRAVNEIALLDHVSGRIYYGIESLQKILGNSFPALRPVLSFAPCKWLLRKLYRFISYNRRVIIPARPQKDQACMEPAFSRKYRLAYIIVACLFTGFILKNYSHLLTGLVKTSSYNRELFICAGQIFWQLAALSILKQKNKWDYLGNMMTVSLAGGIALLPALLLSRYVAITPVFFSIYFGVIVSLMLLEHWRRMKVLRFSWLLSVTWISYRMLLLVFILK